MNVLLFFSTFFSLLLLSQSVQGVDDESIKESIWAFGETNCHLSAKTINSDLGGIMMDCVPNNGLATEFTTHLSTEFAEKEDVPTYFKSFEGSFASEAACMVSFNLFLEW